MLRFAHTATHFDAAPNLGLFRRSVLAADAAHVPRASGLGQAVAVHSKRFTRISRINTNFICVYLWLKRLAWFWFRIRRCDGIVGRRGSDRPTGLRAYTNPDVGGVYW